jgi:hypothetical protein
MEVRYSEKARQPREVGALLERATQMLENVVGASAGAVRAEWDRADDLKGRPIYSLLISDFGDSAQTRFAPDELQRPNHVNVRLHRLWGDLLEARSRRQLEELQRN